MSDKPPPVDLPVRHAGAAPQTRLAWSPPAYLPPKPVERRLQKGGVSIEIEHHRGPVEL